ncbi:MAG TPA: extracellular solute-binding protein [Streptosporangiaceae bacterium]
MTATTSPWPLRAVAFAAAAVLTAATTVYQHESRYRHGCGRSRDDNTIVMVSGEDITPGRRREELIKTWNDQHPLGPRVRLVSLPGGSDQEYSQMLAAQQLGSCLYDVLSLDVVWMQEFIRSGYLDPFTPAELAGLDQPAFLPKTWATGAGRDGRQYAIPFTSDVGLLYYRKDIVKRPPRTWDELRRMTTPAALRRLPGRDKAGLVTQLADYEGLTVNGMEAVWGAGGTIAEGQDGRIVVDDAAAAGLHRLVDGMTASSPLILADSAEFRESDSLTAFIDGRALFLRDWPYAYPVIAADPLLKDRVGVAELPGPAPDGPPGAGALGGQDLAIPKNALHKEEARRFIRFLTEPAQQRRLYACTGYVPVRVEAYRDVAACSQLTGERPANPRESPDSLTARQLRGLSGILLRAIDRARQRPDVLYYPGFSRAFHRYLHDALTQRGVVDAGALSRLLTTCAGRTPPGAVCP